MGLIALADRIVTWSRGMAQRSGCYAANSDSGCLHHRSDFHRVERSGV